MIPMNTVNEPPYKLTDLFSEIVDDINSVLRKPGSEVLQSDLVFRYGYYTELLATLKQEDAPGSDDKKYPSLWLMQPFTLIRDSHDYYAKVKDGIRLFIITGSEVNLKAAEREAQNFDPTLNPIYVQLMKSMKKCVGLRYPVTEHIDHEVTSRYYWGKDQQLVIPDVADCIELRIKKTIINNNLNC